MIRIRKGTLFGAKKNYFEPLGVSCLETRFQIRAQLIPFQSESQQAEVNV